MRHHAFKLVFILTALASYLLGDIARAQVTGETVLRTDKVKVGRRLSSIDRILEFDINQGLNNPKIETSPLLSDIRLKSSSVKIGNGTTANQTLSFNNGTGTTGVIRWNNAEGKIEFSNNALDFKAIGTGGGGVQNFIEDGNADDTSTSIFIPYADAPGTRPIDGSGGSPTVTTSTTDVNPLTGTKSFLLTKPAANVQGQGWSVPFTVDPAFQAKSNKISVKYIVNSGTFTAGSSGGTNSTESDVIFYLYNVTRGQLLEPSNIKLFSNGTLASDVYEASFQTDLDSASSPASYRLIAHVQTTSSAQWELKVDDVTVTPQSYVFGTPVTDVQNFIPTGSWVTNTTYGGMFRRVGDHLQMRVVVNLLGAPNATALTINLPPGYTIDTSKLPLSPRISLGHGMIVDAGIQTYHAQVRVNTSTSVQVNAYTSAAAYSEEGPVTNTVPFTFGVNDVVTVDFSVPVVGLSSSVQVSDNADTRVVAAVAEKMSAQSIPSAVATVITNYTSTPFDSHGAFNLITGQFRCPVFGFYKVTGSIAWDIASGVGSRGIHLRKNGIPFASQELPGSTAAFATTMASKTVLCSAGDLIDMTGSQNSGGNLSTLGSGLYQYLSIARETGPSQINESERVSAIYTQTSGAQSFANGVAAMVNYDIRIEDTHGAVTTGVGWRFTAPIAGTYCYNASIEFNSGGGWNIGEVAELFVIKQPGGINSGDTRKFQQVAHSQSIDVQVDQCFPLLAGEYFEPTGLQNSGGSLSLVAATGVNKISIWRLK